MLIDVFLSFLVFSVCVSAIKLLELKIDKHTVKGNATVLECKFDLEGETLYAVKWYKDGNEFYRYLPKDEPQIQVFSLPGVHVDVSFPLFFFLFFFFSVCTDLIYVCMCVFRDF